VRPLYLLLSSIAVTASSTPQTPQSYKIAVDVDLVVLHPTVRTDNGSIAAHLEERNFEVYEDGRRQIIGVFRHEDAPVTVGLVVDHSSSMRHKLKDVIAAAHAFVLSSRPDDQMFVINFNEKVSLGLAGLNGLASGSAEIKNAISRMPAEGMTALYDAVLEGERRLEAGGYEKKVLIVISDGGDNASKHSLAQALKVAQRSSALIYTIGIFGQEDEDRNPDALRRLALATGGEAFFPNEYKDVVSVCDRIAHDIRHQYTIGYISSSRARPGVYRSIRVVARSADKSKLTVRARAGYVPRGTDEIVK